MKRVAMIVSVAFALADVADLRGLGRLREWPRARPATAIARA